MVSDERKKELEEDAKFIFSRGGRAYNVCVYQTKKGDSLISWDCRGKRYESTNKFCIHDAFDKKTSLSQTEMTDEGDYIREQLHEMEERLENKQS